MPNTDIKDISYKHLIDDKISIGMKYHNRLNHNELVEITRIGNKIMWGLKGKEDIIIKIYYNVIRNVLGHTYIDPQKGQTTQDNFLDKYISVEDLRDDKISQILGE
jgi:hypothetical protein